MFRKKNIYILGHKNEDIDSVASIYLLKKVLEKERKKVIGIIQGFDLEENVENFIEEFNLKDKFTYTKNLPTDGSFILVITTTQHNQLGILNLCIYLIIIKRTKIKDSIIEPYSSCALLIYDHFKNVYKFDEKEKEMILGHLVDTLFLKSSKFRKSDKKILKELGLYTNKKIEYWKEKYLKEDDFNKSLEVLSLNDTKTHQINNNTIISSCLKYKTGDNMLKADKVFQYIMEKSSTNKNVYYLFIGVNLKDLKTIAQLIKDKK